MKSIRSIIFSWFFLGIFFFFFFLVLGTYALSRKMIRDFVIEDHGRMVEHLASNITSNFQRQLQALDIVTYKSSFQQQNWKQNTVSNDLQQFLDYDNIFNSIHVYRANGDLMLAVKRKTVQPYTPEKNIRDNPTEAIPYFDRAVATGVKELSDIVKSKRGFVYQVYFIPLTDLKGHVFAVVSGAISPELNKPDYLVEGMSFFDHNFVALYGNKVNMITSSAQPKYQAFLENLKLDDFKQDSKKSVDFISYKFDKEQFYVFHKYIPELKYWLVLGLNEEIILNKQKTVIKYLFILMCFGSVFALGLSYFLGRRISDPFELMIKSLKQMHLGNFEQKIHYDKHDEIGYLCHLINKLNSKIEKDRYLGYYWTSDEELERIKRGDSL